MIRLSNKHIFAVMAMTLFTVAFTGCVKEQHSVEHQNHVFDSLYDVAWFVRDTCVLPTIDSFEMIGELSAHEADFLRGVTYDRSRQLQVGERYYLDVYQTTDPEKDGWDFYLKVSNRLAQLRMTTSNYEGALKVATEAMEMAKNAGQLTESVEKSFLWTIASCQSELHLPEAMQTSMRVYELLQKQAQDYNVKMTPNLMIYNNVICTRYLDEENYDEAEVWNQGTECRPQSAMSL